MQIFLSATVYFLTTLLPDMMEQLEEHAMFTISFKNNVVRGLNDLGGALIACIFKSHFCGHD